MLCRFLKGCEVYVGIAKAFFGYLRHKRGIKCTYFEFHSGMKQTIASPLLASELFTLYEKQLNQLIKVLTALLTS